jgi:hypothetical protein
MMLAYLKLVSLDDFHHRERPDLDLTQCAGGFPGGEAQRLVPAGLDAGRNPPVAMIDGDDLLVIDQATDHLIDMATPERFEVKWHECETRRAVPSPHDPNR